MPFIIFLISFFIRGIFHFHRYTRKLPQQNVYFKVDTLAFGETFIFLITSHMQYKTYNVIWFIPFSRATRKKWNNFKGFACHSYSGRKSNQRNQMNELNFLEMKSKSGVFAGGLFNTSQLYYFQFCRTKRRSRVMRIFDKLKHERFTRNVMYLYEAFNILF